MDPMMARAEEEEAVEMGVRREWEAEWETGREWEAEWETGRELVLGLVWGLVWEEAGAEQRDRHRRGRQRWWSCSLCSPQIPIGEAR